ncbi:hypothetical protein, conserved [Trypanosoma brucei brucei TREU927]|uniref:Galactose oxidase n=1 Tax=Trypanosoma brucei brucei (strain 927/4 GUTat10.1) TaxID=185431 RepID=Q38B15_TRYB2|nr:hypothetical protein, conserved [Trypanosoma brucei brucei TREU927]EAN78005.1 hypothetical protein, conserved [Trypanosoma brucei brucei TREU927]
MQRVGSEREGRRGSYISSHSNEADAAKAESGHLTAFRAATLPEPKTWLQRTGHTIVVYKSNMFLFGGTGPNSTYSSSIFCNEKMTLQWKECRGVGVVPTGRANHTSVLVENKMFVFGGHRELEVFDELYIVNLDSMRWEKVSYEHVQGPGPVFSHAAVFIPPTQAMIVIGGFHQRKHNTYIAHSFDIRSRTWTGIHGPSSVNPLHLQLVNAVYHHQSISLIVVGMSMKSCGSPRFADTPSIFAMNIYSCFWTELTTAVSPSSPIAFRMPLVWEHFLEEHISVGGIYDERRQEFYFPIMMAPIEGALVHQHFDRRPSSATSVTGQQSSRSILRSASTVREPEGDGKVKFDGCAVFRLQLRTMTWSLTPVVIPKRVVNSLLAYRAEVRSGKGGKRASSRMRRRATNDKKASSVTALFSSNGVSVYQRKYAYACISSSALRKSGGDQKHILMHGGLFDECIALLLAPVFHDNPMDSASLDSVSLLNASVYSTLTVLTTDNVNSGKSAYEFSRSDYSDAETKATEAASSSTGGNGSMPPPSTEENRDVSVTSLHLRRRSSDVHNSRAFPSPRVVDSKDHFALLYHPNNAMNKPQHLPDANYPVAVLRSEKEVRSWAEDFYQDTRDKVIENVLALREKDKKERKQFSRSRKAQKSSSVGGSDEDVFTDDDSSESKGLSDGKVVEKAQSPRQGRGLFGIIRPNVPVIPRDFFYEKNLDVFALREHWCYDLQHREKKQNTSQHSRIDAISRVNMKVRRLPENNRLPLEVFGQASVENISGAASLAAYLLMEAALARCEDDTAKSRRQRTLIRWRYLRVMVLNGEASSIMYFVNAEANRGSGVNVSTTSKVVLGPELYVKGPNPKKVPTRPVPYTIPQLPSITLRAAEVTPSGYTLYRYAPVPGSGGRRSKNH